MRLKNIVSWVVLLTLVGGIFLAFTNAREIRDWFALRNYQAPARVIKLADDTSMDDDTRRIFYVNHPELNQKSEFRQNCDFKEESIILGCFVNEGGIYKIFLLDVDEPRLEGVIEVTAAHEVLHAIYDRLGSDERRRVDKMTNDFFKTIKDERIIKTVENYRKNKSDVVPNELHSILGTEVEKLPVELEDYYSQYFNDRQKIVAYSQQYEQAFVQLEERVENLQSQINSIKAQLENNQSMLASREAEIQQRRQELDRLLNNNQVEEYNLQVAPFNQLVSSYNRLGNDNQQLINRYNRIVQDINSLVVAEQELQEALDSSVIQEETPR